jgi:hypothetical protein
MKSASKQTLTRGIGLAAVAGAFWAGSASASSAPLDVARENVAQAVLSLEQIRAPAGDSAFEAHRQKAIMLLTRAQAEILKAKQLGTKQ